MNFIHIIELELFVGIALVSGILAWGKPLGKQICLTVTVPLSYFFSFLLLKAGALDGIGNAIASFLATATNLEPYMADSTAMAGLVRSVSAALARQLLIVPLFWIFLLITGILCRIIWKVAKAKDRWRIFSTASPAGKTEKGITVGLGVLTGCLVLMLSFTPAVFTASLLAPVAGQSGNEEISGTYAGELAATVEREILPIPTHSPVLSVGRCIGVKQLMQAVTHSLGNAVITTDAGVRVSYNVNDTLSGLLRDGIDALAVYEHLQKPNVRTVSDLAPAIRVLEDIAGREVLLRTVAEIYPLLVPEENAEEAAITGNLLHACRETYAGAEGGAALGGDILRLSRIFGYFSASEPDCRLAGDELLDGILRFVSDEENAAVLAKDIAALSVYNGTVTELSVFGAKTLCNLFDISQDREKEYERFCSLLTTAVNDRTVSRLEEENFDELEAFLRYLSEEEISLGSYRAAHKEADGKDDIACRIYDLYFKKAEAIYRVYQRYDLYRPNGCRYFIGTDGTVFRWDAETDLISVYSGTPENKPVLLLTDALLRKSEGYFSALEDDEILFDEIALWCEDILVKGVSLPDAYRSILTFTAREDCFNPDVVYFETLEEEIRAAATRGSAESDTAPLSHLLARAGQTFASLRTAEKAQEAWLLQYFEQIGGLLDALHAFRLTESVPEAVLKAVAGTPAFSKYVVPEDVQKAIDNAKDGVSDYQTFLGSIQALYNIANQVK